MEQNNNNDDKYLITAKMLSANIEKKSQPIIVVVDNIIVAFNSAASKLWENLVDDMRVLIAEDLVDVLEHYKPSEEQRCFFKLETTEFTMDSFIH